MKVLHWVTLGFLNPFFTGGGKFTKFTSSSVSSLVVKVVKLIIGHSKPSQSLYNNISCIIRKTHKTFRSSVILITPINYMVEIYICVSPTFHTRTYKILFWQNNFGWSLVEKCILLSFIFESFRLIMLTYLSESIDSTLD